MHERYQQTHLDDALRTFYKTKCGCVIRAAESVFGVSATEDEWDERIEVFENLGPLLDIVLKKRSADSIDELLDYVQSNKEDNQRVISYFEHLHRQETPLGYEARKFSMSYIRANRRQMRRSIKRGSRLLLMTDDHIAHVDYIPWKGFISRSDGNIPYTFERALSYPTIIFSPNKRK